jgi:ElaB/YqjD/DUF883 family membrane-anchored ribosome-binding protein
LGKSRRRFVLSRPSSLARSASDSLYKTHIRESASEAGDFLRTTIEERPYTTAAIAFAIGFLIGRFGHRSDY